jgi:hypothetical protein
MVRRAAKRGVKVVALLLAALLGLVPIAASFHLGDGHHWCAQHERLEEGTASPAGGLPAWTPATEVTHVACALAHKARPHLTSAPGFATACQLVPADEPRGSSPPRPAPQIPLLTLAPKGSPPSLIV